MYVCIYECMYICNIYIIYTDSRGSQIVTARRHSFHVKAMWAVGNFFIKGHF